MGKHYYKDGEVITRAKGQPQDRIAARERARYVERKTRANKQSSDPFMRHIDQITIGMIASDQRRRQRREKRVILFAAILVIVVSVLILLAQFI